MARALQISEQIRPDPNSLAFMTLSTISCCFQKIRDGVQSPIKEEEVMDSSGERVDKKASRMIPMIPQ